jgi:hypothetical protein
MESFGGEEEKGAAVCSGALLDVATTGLVTKEVVFPLLVSALFCPRGLCFSLLITHGGVQLGPDGGERQVDFGRQSLHAGHCGEGDQERNQCVFNQILTGFIIVQSAEYFQGSILHVNLLVVELKKFGVEQRTLLPPLSRK